MDVLKVYQYALDREFEGKRFFEENAERLSHAAAVGAFKNLAAEEQKHIEFIQEQINRIKNGESSNIAMGKEMQSEGFFSQRAISESIDSKTLEAMVPDLPILRMAYLIERDFAEFYEKAAKEAAGDAKEALTMLANWEHSHEELFRQLHDKAFEEYSKMPWGG
jgi:rubrerythrin